MPDIVLVQDHSLKRGGYFHDVQHHSRTTARDWGHSSLVPAETIRLVLEDTQTDTDQRALPGLLPPGES